MTDDDRVLERVRKLLTRAEHPATPPAEAEACSAKAAELMSRHLIDEAMVAAGRTGPREDPVVRRIVVEPPYSVAKVVILGAVAGAFGIPIATGRVDSSTQARRCTLVGFAADLSMVELLFTSLLLQASAAMRHASEGHPNVKAFRRAFLFGYASAIGSRLRAVREETVAAAESAAPGTDVVLVDRQARVQAAFDREFPRLGTFRASAGNSSGFIAGHDAGARADLSARQSRLGRTAAELSA